jgi:hypothetical protein
MEFENLKNSIEFFTFFTFFTFFAFFAFFGRSPSQNSLHPLQFLKFGGISKGVYFGFFKSSYS